jgi:2-iminobutanoate/2-iminopropanoate deaminase
MKKIVSTSDAPAAIGPYSQAVRCGSMLFCAGQIPLDPKTGQMVNGDVAAQARRVMENIAGLLKAEHLSFDHVVKTTIFLTSMDDFQTVNEVYGSYFRENPPARSTVAVAGLPKGAKVEIEVVAMGSGGGGQTVGDTSG